MRGWIVALACALVLGVIGVLTLGARATATAAGSVRSEGDPANVSAAVLLPT